MSNEEIDNILKSPTLLSEINFEKILEAPDPVDDKEADLLLKQVQNEVALENNLKQSRIGHRLVNHSIKGYSPKDDEFARRVAGLSVLKESSPVTDNTSLGIGGLVPKPVELKDFVDETDNWCSLCNEDAQLICRHCSADNDDEEVRYCSRCFTECHREDSSLRKHIASKIK